MDKEGTNFWPEGQILEVNFEILTPRNWARLKWKFNQSLENSQSVKRTDMVIMVEQSPSP
jgi:hypothetical protein